MMQRTLLYGTAVKMASIFHCLWGILLITVPYDMVPRPFGALEMYFKVMDYHHTGLMLASTSAMALTGVFTRHGRIWWIRPLLTVPQQAVLVWALAWATFHVHLVGQGEVDTRTLFSSAYLLPITMFHTLEVVNMWRDALLARMVDHGSGTFK